LCLELTVSLVGVDVRPRNIASKKETLAIGNTEAPTQRGFVNLPQIETADEMGK
jgi:hypothetical protein